MCDLFKINNLFDNKLYDRFLLRVEKNENKKCLEFLVSNDLHTNGLKCTNCHTIKPVYCYRQHKTCKYGLYIKTCSDCLLKLKSPWECMLNGMKLRSKKRNHPNPEFTVNELEDMFKQQKGRCFISGDILNAKMFDGDPYNMSCERLDNSKGYVKGNVVIIAQYLQLGQHYDFGPNEIKSWFNYNSVNDGFVFNPSDLLKPIRNEREKRRKIIKGDKQQCTDCRIFMLKKCFSKNHTVCRNCDKIRSKKRRNTPHGFIMNMSQAAKRRMIIKGVKSNTKLSKLFTDKIIQQKGRCAWTGIPFVYKSRHKFAPSPDRIDDTKSYNYDNVRIIISPLNTRNNKI